MSWLGFHGRHYYISASPRMRLRLFYGRHLRLQLGEKIIQIGSSKAENGRFKEPNLQPNLTQDTQERPYYALFFTYVDT